MQNEFWYYHNDYIIGLSFLIDFITYKNIPTILLYISSVTV